jgi:hypothetical protein
MNVHRVAAGAVVRGASGLRLLNFADDGRTYTNAQLDDYQTLERRDFCWRPPLRLHVRGRFSHPADQLRGTAGFGFWNDPFLMSGWRWPAPPRALWFFFASPPSDMALTLTAPGWGWKAAVIDAAQPAALRWLPLAPLIIPALRSRTLHRWLWPRVQRDLGIAEAPVSGLLTTWRDYEIAWGVHESTFYVDGEAVLAGAPAPHGPLGLVIWIDNQYLVVHPSGRLRWGVLALAQTQWLEIDELELRR